MYNGIGLFTPRGTGTSGYVQANRARAPNASYAQRVGDVARKGPRDALLRAAAQRNDKTLVEHERRRHIELKVLELREELEDKNEKPEIIKERTRELRRKLMKRLTGDEVARRQSLSHPQTSSYARQLREQEKNERVRRAFGLGRRRRSRSRSRSRSRRRSRSRPRPRGGPAKTEEEMRSLSAVQQLRELERRQQAQLGRGRRVLTSGADANSESLRERRLAREKRFAERRRKLIQALEQHSDSDSSDSDSDSSAYDSDSDSSSDSGSDSNRDRRRKTKRSRSRD
ncbi:MAG: hypothetical protein MHM6MM_000689 [Cercozoa sp. M6MM]